MASQPHIETDSTAPGVRYLRMLWGIPDKPARQEAPENVNTNIYETPNRQRIGARRFPSHP